MAILARKTTDAALFALVQAHNDSRRATTFLSTSFHADITAKTVSANFYAPTATSAAITSANASDLATLLTLCAEIAVVHALHVGDDLAHKTATGAHTLTNSAPTDLATALVFLNDVKAKYNLHVASTTFHYTADATNTISAAAASDLATSITMANEYKTDFNAHIISSPAGASVKLIGP